VWFFFFFFFLNRVSLISLVSLDHDLPISISHVAGIIGTCYHTQLFIG
jgi:hypothetical protein